MNIIQSIKRHSLLLTTAISLAACGGGGSGKGGSGGSSSTQPALPPTETDNTHLVVPEDFDYNMNQDITLRIQVLDHNGNPGKHIAVTVTEATSFELSQDEDPVPQPAPLQNVISRGQTDAQGYFEQLIRLPGYLREVRVQVSQLGIDNVAVLNINNPVIFHEFK